MKVKVRGLVFVGFAAAVFASSALAATPEQIAADKKTVTSKYYVDTTFQTLDNITTTSELTVGGDVTEQMVNAHWASNSEYPSMAVLKEVRDTLDAVNVVDDDNYVDVNENSTGTFTVGLDNAKIDSTGADIQASTMTNDGNLVTAGAVKAFAQDKRKIDAATGDGSVATPYGTTITASSANDTYPTSQNVYQFVKGAIDTAGEDYQRKLENNEAGLYVGKYENNDSTWKALEAVDDVNAQVSKEYVTIATGTGGVYKIDLRDDRIGYNGVAVPANNIVSDITASSDKLATGKAVYEFVTDAISAAGEGYQPVVSSADTVVIGYQATGGDSGWKTLTGDGSYVNVAYNGTTGNAEVSLTNIGADADVYGTSTSNDTKLATTGSVRKLLDTTLTATGENDQKVPTSKAVVDYVTAQVDTQFALGTNPCKEAGTAGSYCALVASYDSNTQGVKYEWTVMAPVPSNP